MLKFFKFCSLFFILWGPSVLLKGQNFSLTSDHLLPLYGGQIEWADLDNDNDLDIIYSGFAEGANEYYIKVYENNNGLFISRDTGLPNIRNGSFALGDYDKDGDLDLLITGLSGSENISDIYENNGMFLFSIRFSFLGLINARPSWFDIDNDEDLDFLITGTDDQSTVDDPFVLKMMVYENTGTMFIPIENTNLSPCTQCSMDWADSNGDGNIDVIITGLGEGFEGHTSLYVNNGNRSFTKNENSIFEDVYNGDVKWGDIDNDGDLDILLSGILENGIFITFLYRNEGGRFQKIDDIQINSTGENWLNGTKWADYNNDGLLDILISGRGTSVVELEYVLKLYQNNGDGSFEDVAEINFSGISDSSVDFGDFDNDGDVDICFTGTGPAGLKTGIYENNLLNEPFVSNNKSAPPNVMDFSERFFRKQVILRWSNGTDAQTPTPGLSYNFYLRNATSLVTVPTSNLSSGNLLTNNPPNGHAKRAILNDIPEGDNFWAVQSVDGGKLGSSFSTEKHFYQINGPETIKAEIVDAENIKLSWTDNSSIETSYHITRSIEPITGFSSLVTLPQDAMVYVDNYTFLTDAYYYYRVNAASETKSSAYDSLRVLIPTAPIDLDAQSVNASKITLTWGDQSNYETGYQVERKLSTEVTFEIISTLAPNQQTFTDTGLNEGTIYDYRVRAINEYGSSGFSNISTAQTNFRPLGNDLEQTTLEDEVMLFNLQYFTDGFFDPDGNDELALIVLETLPEKGVLELSMIPVTAGQIIPLEELSNLRFVPVDDENGISEFRFYNNDGKDNSSVSYVFSLKIAAVNDAPEFSAPTIINVSEDFHDPIKILPLAAPVPQDEVSQVVSYTVQPVYSEKVTLNFDSGTGELNLTSVLNEFGEMEFTITADDGQSENNIVSKTVKLVIEPVNDLPVLSAIPDQEWGRDEEISPIHFSVIDVDNQITTVLVSATSDNQQLVKNDNIIINGEGEAKVLFPLPEEGSVGESFVTVTANDGVGLASIQFKLTIVPITGISESINNGIKVYPNPVVSNLTVNMTEPSGYPHELVISDLLGKELLHQLIYESESTVNIEDMNSGIYLLSIRDGNGGILFHKRIVKN